MNCRKWKAAFGVLLTVVCVWLLMGCIYVPLPNIPQNGTRNVATEVGNAKSNRVLRATKSTREQVLAHLGEPWFTSADNRLIGYRWTAATGYVTGCATDELIKDNFILLLGFDENDTLKTFRVKRDRPALRQEINSLLPPGQTLPPPEPKKL